MMDLNTGLDTLYGALFSDDRVEKWTSLAPPTSGSRANIDSADAYDAIHSVSFSHVGSASASGGGSVVAMDSSMTMGA